ncbi:MAG TPA: fluoride efflux transporter CrcB [Propionibacteriaceae bacterium]|nr:fluoride efflux transporter CrcB [Propionibacteriaceae bacterium]
MLLLAVCGGLGAVVRFVVDGLIRSRVRSIGSIGTLVINVTGAVALGIIAGLVAAHVAQPDWQLVIGTGFLGGYTTFSTTSFETVRLVQQGRIRLAVGLGLAQLALALAGAAGGFALGLSL